MSKRPYIKSDAAGNLTDLELDAASLDGHIMEQTGISSNTTTVPTTAQVKSYVDAAVSGGIIELSTQYIRITDLDTGIYKLTYDGDRYLYYNGTASLLSVAVSSGFNLLSVTKTSSAWYWSFASNIGVIDSLFEGVTYTDSGVYYRDSVVHELSQQTINIRTLPAGQYRLTYNGAKTIYYGDDEALPTTYDSFAGTMHLTVNTYKNTGSGTTLKVWRMLGGANGQYIFSGYTNEAGSSCSYSLFDVSKTYLTSYRYRPVKVNGTQILSNTASTALNLVAGTNVTLTNSGGSVTIDASDKYRPVQVNGTQILADSSTTPLNLTAGTGITLTNSGGSVTVASSGGNMYHHHIILNYSYEDEDEGAIYSAKLVFDLTTSRSTAYTNSDLIALLNSMCGGYVTTTTYAYRTIEVYYDYNNFIAENYNLGIVRLGAFNTTMYSLIYRTSATGNKTVWAMDLSSVTLTDTVTSV